MAKKRGLEYIARLSGVVVTLVLLMFVVLFAQFLATELWGMHTYKKPTPPKFPDDPQWKTHMAGKLFLPDGTLHLVNKADMQRYSDDYTKEEITDVNGSVLWQGIHKDRPFKYLAWVSFIQNSGEWQMRNMSQLNPNLSGVLEVPVRVEGEVKEVWQYDFEAQAFTGCEVAGGLIGYLGADGFAASKAQPFGEFKGFTSWTDENPSSVVMLWQTKRRIYQIDFRSRKVETVFDSSESDIVSIRWHQWRPMNPSDRDTSDIQYRPLIDCRTADNKHHLIMREPNQILVVELPEQMREREPNQILMRWQSNVDFTATGDAIFAQYRQSNFNPPASPKLLEQYRREYDSKPQPQSRQLYKVVDDGNLEFVSRFDWIKPASKTSYLPDRREIIQKWARKASPPVFDLLWYLFGDGLYKMGTGMMQGYATIIMEGRPGYSSLNYVLGAAMVAFALWHGWARRTSWGRMLCWLAVVALFGIAGLLTYLAINHTPVIKCPACGKKRGLESDGCARCGSTLPIPQSKPTDLIMAN